jgi:hypothetical protein
MDEAGLTRVAAPINPSKMLRGSAQTKFAVPETAEARGAEAHTTQLPSPAGCRKAPALAL